MFKLLTLYIYTVHGRLFLTSSQRNALARDIQLVCTPLQWWDHIFQKITKHSMLKTWLYSFTEQAYKVAKRFTSLEFYRRFFMLYFIFIFYKIKKKWVGFFLEWGEGVLKMQTENSNVYFFSINSVLYFFHLLYWETYWKILNLCFIDKIDVS